VRSGAFDRRGMRSTRDEDGGIPYRWLLVLALVRARTRTDGETAAPNGVRRSGGAGPAR